VAICAIAGGAAASDLTVKGRVAETIELNDNYGLSPNPSGVLGSYSSGNFSALYATPTTRFTLNGDVVYRKYFGPGAEATSLTETTSDGVSMRFERDGKALGDRDFVYAGRTRQDTSFAQRNDIGFSNAAVKNDIITYTDGAGGARRLTGIDVINGSVDAVQTAYSPPNSSNTPFNTYRASGGWSHSATHTIDLNMAGNIGLSKFENSADTQVVGARMTGGATIRLSDRLKVAGNAGMVIFKTTQNAIGPVVIVPTLTDPFNTPLFTPAPAVAGTSTAPVWDASLNYQLFTPTSITFTASQEVSQGALGDIAKRTQFTLGLNHNINAISTLTLFAGLYTYEPPAGGTATTNFIGSASYSYRLSRDWNATATYIYRKLESSTSTGITSTPTGVAATASSNALLFVVAKEFVLVP
jgi:hypothetical protein